jgi:PKD domain
VITATVGADGSLAVLGTTPAEHVESVAVSPDGRFLYYQYFNGEVHEEGIGVAELGVAGTPTPTSAFAPFSPDEARRLVFAPDPTPTAAFGAAPGAPGAATSFDASASVGAVRYDWDFGDGTVLEGGGPTPSHVYASPGAYTATLKVTDANGCSSVQIYTGQSTTCPGGAAATATNAVPIALPVITNAPPSLTALRVDNRRFAVKGARMGKATRSRRTKHSTTFRYRLSEPAKVTFTIERKMIGRKVGDKCKHRTRGNSKSRKCVLRFRREGSPFSTAGKQGGNGTRFAGKVPRGSGKGKRKLRPGVYRVTAVATDADGARSQPRRASFSIVAG